MTFYAKDEYCMYCGLYHPRMLHCCTNLKQAKIEVLSESTKTIITHDIVCYCPNCNEQYEVTIDKEEDDFNVNCCNCNKWFIAKRELS